MAKADDYTDLEIEAMTAITHVLGMEALSWIEQSLMQSIEANGLNVTPHSLMLSQLWQMLTHHISMMVVNGESDLAATLDAMEITFVNSKEQVNFHAANASISAAQTHGGPATKQ